jgi:lysophospholipase L1-like esterase
MAPIAAERSIGAIVVLTARRGARSNRQLRVPRRGPGHQRPFEMPSVMRRRVHTAPIILIELVVAFTKTEGILSSDAGTPFVHHRPGDVVARPQCRMRSPPLNTMMRRATLVSALSGMAFCLALMGATTIVGAPAAGASTPPFYLDIGGSASIGVQPSSTGAHNQRTDHGYSNDVVAVEAAKGVTLTLDEIGCSGETTTTMLNGGDKCYISPDSQLAEAISFLAAHHDQTGLVTIDLGFNDLRNCLHSLTVDPMCVSDKLELLQDQLPEILTDLKAAAGPDTTFVGVGHYNPYLADETRGRSGRAFADKSSSVVRSLNNTLSDIYATFDIPMANVAKQFSLDTSEYVHLPGVGTVPGIVARTCELTWMCPLNGVKPNIHPDDAGYLAIAEAIDAVLPPTL